jgi:hypothetical protein
VSHIPLLRRPLRRCPYCWKVYRAHPGWSDHRDECDLNPMNRPHIIGTAVAMYGGASE